MPAQPLCHPLIVLISVFVSTLTCAHCEEHVEFLIGDRMESEGGHWQPADSPVNRPFGVDFDTSGNMYLVELEGGRVFRMDTKRQLTQISGDGSKGYKGDGGVAGDATYNGMHNCAVTPAGDLFISDSWNHCIRRIDLKTGLVSTIAGTGKKGFGGDQGPATDATFDYLMCISLSHDDSLIHITDLSNRRIREMNLKTGMVRTVAGNGQKGVPTDGAMAVSSPFVDPRAAVADSQGRLYVLERGGHALRVVETDGTIRTVAGTGKKGFADGPALSAQLNAPKHICVDPQDNVYIADDENAAIRKYDPVTRTLSTLLGRGFGDKQIQLSHPHGVCVQGDWLYVCDSSNNRVLRIQLATR